MRIASRPRLERLFLARSNHRLGPSPTLNTRTSHPNASTYLPHTRAFSMSYALQGDGSVKYTTNTNRPAMPGDIPSEGYTAQKTDDYLDSKLLVPEYGADPTLSKSRKRAHEAGIPEISVSPQQGQFLSVLARGMGATRILEIGTLYGYSTVFLARALPRHGQIDTLEISPLHAKIANQTFIDADLYPFPKVHVGPALDTLKKMEPPGVAEGQPETSYDLVFIDADKENIAEYFQEALRLTRKGGVIFVDNAIRGGRIASEQNDRPDIDVVGLRKLYDWVQKDDGKTVLMSGMQTVGSKHWDGFAIATKL